LFLNGSLSFWLPVSIRSQAIKLNQLKPFRLSLPKSAKTRTICVIRACLLQAGSIMSLLTASNNAVIERGFSRVRRIFAGFKDGSIVKWCHLFYATLQSSLS